ncbi:MAG: MFS transporter, partial [Candidatus Baltobacteraceae bacterium]
LYPLYQRALGISSPVITIIFAVYALAVIAGLLFFGHQSDRVGRRKVLLFGLLLSAMSAVAFWFARDLTLIYTGRVLSGVSAGIFTGAGTAAMVDYASEQRRRAVTLLAVVVNVGGLGVGTLISGLLAQEAPLPMQLPYAADFLLV